MFDIILQKLCHLFFLMTCDMLSVFGIGYVTK